MAYFLLLTVFISSCFGTVVSQTNPPCPNGNWRYFAKSNKCLQVFGAGGGDGVAPATWPKAEDYCNRFSGGHLASLESDDEITFVVKLTHETGYDTGDYARIYIGLTYSGSSGWSRPDGSSLTYVRWYAGGGDGHVDGRFPSGLLFTRRTLTSYMWVSDQGADMAFPFVCEATPGTEGRK